MQQSKAQHHIRARGITIVGSCGIEEIYRQDAETDKHDIATIALYERTFGGAGLCLATAYSHIDQHAPIYFHSVVGSQMSEGQLQRDCDGELIFKFLNKRKFKGLSLQMPVGAVTEKNIIVLKDSRRSGYRLASKSSDVARKSFDPQNTRLLEDFQNSHSLIVTSFTPEVAVVLFKEFANSSKHTGVEKLCACYTLNSEIASLLCDKSSLQKELAAHINVICLSEEEFDILGGKNSVLHTSVPIILITRGEKGSLIIDNTQGRNEYITARAFEVKTATNDNGAGEAAHAAFIHTLISFKQSPLWKTQSLKRMLQISGYVANVAGALKIQTHSSLDFRNNLDYTIALSMCANTSIKPRMIGAHILGKYLQQHRGHTYYFELTTRQ